MTLKFKLEEYDFDKIMKEKARKEINCSDCIHFRGYIPYRDICNKQGCISNKTSRKGKTMFRKTTYKHYKLKWK